MGDLNNQILKSNETEREYKNTLEKYQNAKKDILKLEQECGDLKT